MKTLNSLKAQIYSVVSFLFLALVCFGIFNFYLFNRVAKKANSYVGDSVSISLKIGRIEAYDRELGRLINNVFKITLTPPIEKIHPKVIEDKKRKFSELNRRVNSEYAELIGFARMELEQFSSDEKLWTAYSKLIQIVQISQENYNIYSRLMEKIFALIEDEQFVLAREIFNDLESADDRIGRLTSEIEEVQELIIDTSRSEIFNAENLVKAYIGLTMFFLFALVLSSIFLVRNIIRPLNTAMHITKRISEGERDIEVPCASSMEFGNLFSSIYEMLQAIRSVESSIRDKTRRLESKVKELDAFAATVSHDLKSPLNTIVGFTQLLEQEVSETGDEEYKPKLIRIKEAGLSMAHLIDDLLEYSRTESCDFYIEKVDLNSLLEEVIGNLQHLIQSNRATIHFTAAFQKIPLITGQKVLLYQLFQNLIVNGIKYRSEAPPQLIIDAKYEGSLVTIIVKDNGIGIPKEYHDKVFEIFHRGDSGSKPAGSGIGLATVRKIVERHGGKIWLESQVGQGSTFYFTLPSSPSSESSLNIFQS